MPVAAPSRQSFDFSFLFILDVSFSIFLSTISPVAGAPAMHANKRREYMRPAARISL
jgi:hypothetical protein